MNGIIETFLLAMTPIGELRAAIPVALTVFKMHWAFAYLVAVLGNLVPVVFLLLLLEPVSGWLAKRFKFFEKFFNWLFERTQQRVGERVKRHGWLMLIPFVAIPLPITGAWTGSLIAFLFKIPLRKALPAIAAGVAIAGAAITLVTWSGIAIEEYFGWQTLVGVLAVVLVTYLIIYYVKPRSIQKV